MINKDKKSKLRKLLARISPDDKGEIFADELKEEIQELQKQIEKPKDYSKSIDVLKYGLETIHSKVLKKLDTLPTQESLEGIKKNYLEYLKKLEVNINEILLSLSSEIKDVDTRLRLLRATIKT